MVCWTLQDLTTITVYALHNAFSCKIVGIKIFKTGVNRLQANATLPTPDKFSSKTVFRQKLIFIPILYGNFAWVGIFY